MLLMLQKISEPKLSLWRTVLQNAFLLIPFNVCFLKTVTKLKTDLNKYCFMERVFSVLKASEILTNLLKNITRHDNYGPCPFS